MIDPFWKKLDLTPWTCVEDEDEEDDVHKVVDGLTNFLDQQPKAQKKHWLSKIKDMFKPGKTQVKDPLVQKTTRGRPVGSKQKPPKVYIIHLKKYLSYSINTVYITTSVKETDYY